MHGYTIEPCSRSDIRDFVEANHYSHNINGVIADYCFRLMDGDKMLGAMIFGRLAMASQWKRYGEKEEDVIELRRLVCIDDTPKNTESFFIGRCLRWLRQNTPIKVVVSYADPEYGHQGIIYRASNFSFGGHSAGGRVIWWRGKKYHDKAIRTKYKGELKPFAKEIKDALTTGEATYAKTAGKYIYLYQLDRKSGTHGVAGW